MMEPLQEQVLGAKASELGDREPLVINWLLQPTTFT